VADDDKHRSRDTQRVEPGDVTRLNHRATASRHTTTRDDGENLAGDSPSHATLMFAKRRPRSVASGTRWQILTGH
jgi:hypothetical protein